MTSIFANKKTGIQREYPLSHLLGATSALEHGCPIRISGGQQHCRLIYTPLTSSTIDHPVTAITGVVLANNRNRRLKKKIHFTQIMGGRNIPLLQFIRGMSKGSCIGLHRLQWPTELLPHCRLPLKSRSSLIGKFLQKLLD